jgi:hypothetical protein
MPGSRERTHDLIHAGGLALMAASLPVSVYFMSVGQLVVAANWLLRGGYRRGLAAFASNRAAWAFSSLYLLYLLGFFWSSDKSFAFGMWLNKLPLLTLVFFITASPPLPRGSKKWLLLVFSASLTVLSFISLGLLAAGGVQDFRELSPFVSHIRVGLMAAFSVLALAWTGLRVSFEGRPLGLSPRFWKNACLITAAWHLGYLLLLQSLSGILALLAAVFVLGARALWAGSPRLRLVSLVLLSLLVAGTASLLAWGWLAVHRVHDEPLDSPETHTSLGNPYRHEPHIGLRENGHLVYVYIADEELENAWGQRSELDYYGPDERGQELRYTLYRFMTSRGLRKDAAGLAQLDEEEIRAVEQGIANHNYLRWPGLLIRVHQTFWELREYRREGNPEGHTLSQRLEYWKAAREAIQRHPLTGWGTGDYLLAMAYGFEQIQSRLVFQPQMKPHNQYLSMMVLFGAVGLLWFLWAVLYPAWRLGGFAHAPFVAFLVIVLASMLLDDTLETQAGITFFLFFYNYFLFVKDSSS